MKTPLARGLVSTALLVYLAVQIGVPLVLYVRDRGVRNTDFAWDMFSQHLECEQLGFGYRNAQREWVTMRPDRYFATPYQVRRILYRDRLVAFAQRVCADLRDEGITEPEVRALAICKLSRDGKPLRLVNPHLNLCERR